MFDRIGRVAEISLSYVPFNFWSFNQRTRKFPLITIERDQLSVSVDLLDHSYSEHVEIYTPSIIKRRNVINDRGTIYRWSLLRRKKESNEFSGIEDHHPLLTYG